MYRFVFETESKSSYKIIQNVSLVKQDIKHPNLIKEELKREFLRLSFLSFHPLIPLLCLPLFLCLSLSLPLHPFFHSPPFLREPLSNPSPHLSSSPSHPLPACPTGLGVVRPILLQVVCSHLCCLCDAVICLQAGFVGLPV